MADTITLGTGIQVTIYAGPRAEGQKYADLMYQITDREGRYVQLAGEDLAELHAFIMQLAARGAKANAAAIAEALKRGDRPPDKEDEPDVR